VHDKQKQLRLAIANRSRVSICRRPRKFSSHLPWRRRFRIDTEVRCVGAHPF